MIRLSTFFRNDRGAGAAEFALILPVALLFLLGTIDVGRYFWQINKLEKAVQAGTRYAVATNLVPSGLDAQSYVDFDCNGNTIKAGETICREALGTITCSKSGNLVSCTCTESALGAGTCPTDLATVNDTAFNSVVTRMRVIDAGIAAADVRISYSGSGIGFAGDPSGTSEIAPIVTVEVASASFRSMSLLGFGIRLPRVRYSQMLEDGDGAIAY